MGYIKINTKYPVYDGAPITFRAPCDCTETEGVSVNSKNFVFKDAHGVALTGMGNLFVKDAVVKVILDVTNSCAYIQNADTNSYLENKDADCVVNHYELPKQFLYESDGEVAGSLTWSVREWESGYVECFGQIFVSSIELIEQTWYSGTYTYNSKGTENGVLGPHELPIALDTSRVYSIQASFFSEGLSECVAVSMGHTSTQNNMKLIITHTPTLILWSPIPKYIVGCYVNLHITGHKFVD